MTILVITCGRKIIKTFKAGICWFSLFTHLITIFPNVFINLHTFWKRYSTQKLLTIKSALLNLCWIDFVNYTKFKVAFTEQAITFFVQTVSHPEQTMSRFSLKQILREQKMSLFSILQCQFVYSILYIDNHPCAMAHLAMPKSVCVGGYGTPCTQKGWTVFGYDQIR